ncbi:MAG: DUF983 domain-containing protein [Rhodothalassiaceae bacterium]
MTERSTFVPAWRAGLLMRCPRCGDAPLFAGLLRLHTRCPACGFDMAAADPGDGPAVFAIFVLGALFTGAALAVEAIFRPPYALHLLIWPPLLALGSLYALRVAKALLIAYQFRFDAREASSKDRDETF